jgi:hypothetical protein
MIRECRSTIVNHRNDKKFLVKNLNKEPKIKIQISIHIKTLLAWLVEMEKNKPQIKPPPQFQLIQ